MTPEQKSTILDAVSAALDGVTVPPPPPVLPWFEDRTSPVPTEPLADPNDVEGIKRYAAHFLRTNLRRGVAPQDEGAFLSISRRLWAVPDTAPSSAADAILPGAGSFSKDVAILLVQGGAVDGLGPFQSAHLSAPLGSAFDMVSAAAWLAANPPKVEGVSGR